jgi:hypothetical protein
MPSIALQRSKAWLEEDGWKVWKVEQWNQWSRQKTDLFNLMDLLAIRANISGVLGVQCCSGDAAAHVKKYLVGYVDRKGKWHGPNEFLDIWKANGNRLVIHDWTKRPMDGERGKRKVWQVREVVL